MHLKPLKEQVVVVVGASSGIGRDVAKGFASRGSRVVAASKSREEIVSLVNEIKDELHGEAIGMVIDVTDAKQVDELGNLAVKEYGRVDTWVHASAVTLYAYFEDTTEEEFCNLMDVNFLGAVNGAKTALRLLRKSGGGSLIIVTSVEARMTLPLMTAYAASKHAVEGFIQGLRIELQHHKEPINLVQILPGTVYRPLLDIAFDKIEKNVNQYVHLIPRYHPSVTANAILYAATHVSRDIVIGGVIKFLLFVQALFPSLMEWMWTKVIWQASKTRGASPCFPGPNQLPHSDSGASRSSWYNSLMGHHPDAFHNRKHVFAALVVVALAVLLYFLTFQLVL